MPEYMLLLHDSTMHAARGVRPEVPAIVAKYKAWGATLAAAGRLRGGAKLRDEGGRFLRRDPAKKVAAHDGPFAETKEVIGGYYTIAAASYDEAVALCADCPHLELGGAIEVREVEDA